MDTREPIEQVIARATAPDSLYWLMRDLGDVDPAVPQMIEVRIDMDLHVAETFRPPGWTVDRIDPSGIVYIRRVQALTDEAVISMFAEVLHLARACNGTFFSWVHGDLLD